MHAARFTNWLHNGQGNGGTETGAYTLSGNTGIIKNVGATVYLPSENEWYKAAYYDPTTGAGGGDNYWLYASQSNTAPTVAAANATGDISNPGANVANYDYGADWNGQDGNVTTVGSAGANNFYPELRSSIPDSAKGNHNRSGAEIASGKGTEETEGRSYFG